ncbi:hypothetical protein MK079_00545 [Candidatus Gracilibacteria bacterium]|nr:hypothetical protein [Candidatus Gracilibacteria bacterium]
MDIKIQIILYISIYILIMIGFSLALSCKQSKEDFLISGRNRSWWSIGMSKYATSIGASWFISYTAYMYEFGMGVFLYALGYFIAMILLGYYIGPKIHKVSKKEGFMGLGDVVFYVSQSRTLAHIVDAFASIALFAWLLVTVIGGANIIEFLGILSYEFSLLSIMLIVLIYVMNVGYKGVVTSDILQGGMILFVLVLMAVSLIGDIDTQAIASVSFDQMAFGTVAGFLIFGIFSAFPFVDRYQLLFSAKNEKEIKKGFLSVIPLILISVLLLMTMGYMLKLNMPNLDPSTAFIHAIQLYTPQALFPLVIVMFFAALMSTVDSLIHAFASNVGIFGIKDRVKNIRINAALISILVLIVCYFFRDIIHLTIFAVGFNLILSVPMIYVLFGKKWGETKKRPSRIISSMFAGCIGFILGAFMIGFNDPTLALFPIIFGGFGLVFFSRFLDSYLSR